MSASTQKQPAKNSPAEEARLSGQVYGHLLGQLAARKLALGDHVKAQVVAGELSVSQATARKAIARLVDDGWLSTGENGRPVVVKHPPLSTAGKTHAAPDGVFEFTSRTESTGRTILELALNREFPLGKVIKARPLAERLGVSLSTVREALDWLCRDGGLVRVPRRGWQFARLKLGEIQTMFEIRRRLEPIVLKRAWRKLHQPTLDALLAETDQIVENFDHIPRIERLLAEHRFHQSLIDMAGDSVLAEVLNPLIRKMMLVVSMTHGLSRSSFPEHRRILLAIRERDLKKATECLKRDLRNPLEVNFVDWD